MKIKICGLRRKEDIGYVNKLKPDYVGFIFAPSKRQVSLYRARDLIRGLDQGIKKVGVFVNESRERVEEIGEACRLDILQFHGEEGVDLVTGFKRDVWKAFSIKDENSLKDIGSYRVDGYLLDSFYEGKRGGTGKTFNWDLVAHLHREKFIILAGGLNLDNIGRAIARVRPQVVDLNSGVETGGYKDFNKMKTIIEKLREGYGQKIR